MPTKLDIMRKTGQNWAIVDGKVKRIEEVVPEPLVVEKEEKKKVEEILKELKKSQDAMGDGIRDAAKPLEPIKKLLEKTKSKSKW